MTVAMMLPTSLPVVATLHRFALNRPDRWLLLSLAITGRLGAGRVTRLRGLCHLDLVCEFKCVAGGACVFHGGTAASCCGRLPVQHPEVSLPGAVPFTIQLRRGALAGVPRALAIAAPWSGSRPLLVSDAVGR